MNESTAMGPADVEACEDYLVTDAVLSGGERERTGQLQSSRSDEPPVSDSAGEGESTGSLQSRNVAVFERVHDYNNYS